MPVARSSIAREVDVAPGLDDATRQWLADLTRSATRAEAEHRLHGLLVRAARTEVRRRGHSVQVHGPDVDDIAYQAAADAMLAIEAKLDQFRGESRFTTWAYKFVIFEVASKLARQVPRLPTVPWDDADWHRLPDRVAVDPAHTAEARDLAAIVKRAVEQQLTAHQRRIFTALVIDGVPLDAVVAETGSSRGAIYKTMFDARIQLRATLVEWGYLPSAKAEQP